MEIARRYAGAPAAGPQTLLRRLVPQPVYGSRHAFKYSLFYGYPGRRAVGYDNERGKGDHRHRDGVETGYVFETLEKLIADFEADVAVLRTEELADE